MPRFAFYRNKPLEGPGLAPTPPGLHLGVAGQYTDRFQKCVVEMPKDAHFPMPAVPVADDTPLHDWEDTTETLPPSSQFTKITVYIPVEEDEDA